MLELEDTGSEAAASIARLCHEAVRREADVIVLGCAGMADLCRMLTATAGVPVVDGVASGVGLATAMVRMGLKTSKRSEYVSPPRLVAV